MTLPKELGDVPGKIPNVILDVRYATPINFTGKQLYLHQLAWLRTEALDSLATATEELEASGYNLVVFDAFRPQSVQKKLRAACSDDMYVLEASNHCRGIAIDVALAYENGNYLDMGTDYDDFTEKAHPENNLITNEQRENRKILRQFMESAGFMQHPHEWWHYDYRPQEKWPLLVDEFNALAP